MNPRWRRLQAEESVGSILRANVRRGNHPAKRLLIDGLQRITVGESCIIAACGTNDRAFHVAADIREGRLIAVSVFHTFLCARPRPELPGRPVETTLA